MIRGFVLLMVLLTLAACSKETADAGGTAKIDPALKKIKFRVQEVADKQQGGLIAVRFAAPQDWKASGLLEWHYNDLYTPVRFSSKAESPDGSAWIETYPAELFYWLDPRWDNFKGGGGSVGGIHQTNVTIQQAMQRYVIQRYRGKEKNLQILGYRPVSNLAKALNQPSLTGEGIDFRVRYESGGQPVDEEFFALMTPKLTIPYHGPQGTTYEYHRALALVHSIGAKGGKLESVRPLLGYMARSYDVDKIWAKQRDAVIKQLLDAYDRNLAAGYAQIEAAGRLSRSISANNDAMIQAMDEQRAAANATRTSSPSESAYQGAEDFDQYIRGTEKVEDSSGNVSEQSSLYSYHWTDGYGNYVHSNDSSFDPNNHSNVPYEKLKPVK
jgi:hypothetical protein